MKLIIVSPFPPNITGIGQYGFHVSRSLAQSAQFQEITVIAGAKTALRREVISSSFTIEFSWHPDQPGAVRAILSEVRRRKPDLVWVNLGASVFGRSPLANLMGFISLGLIKSTGTPTIVTLHELVELADLKTLNAPGGALARSGARLLTRLATQADVVCLTMRRYVDWFAAHRPEVSCVHIPIGAYRAPELLPEPSTPDLLFFTTLAPYKGLEVLLAAYRSLLPRYPGLGLTIAGIEHPRFPGYGEAIRQATTGLPGVRWLGQVPEEQVRALFSRAQVVVLPYVASTGSSSVMYQSAMWGRALVASDLLEMQAIARESSLEVTFFRNRDVEGLAAAIRCLLDSPARRKAQVVHNYTAIQAIRPEETARLYIQAFNRALLAHDIPDRIPIPLEMIPAETG
ncbi:MAG: glycosyltransferase [Chloroflexi bacterium]|nr:MAG: glycosyltransferase [Chloroflexota bacterium]